MKASGLPTELFDITPSALLLSTMDGAIRYANPAFCQLLGLSDVQLHHTYIRDLSDNHDEVNWPLSSDGLGDCCTFEMACGDNHGTSQWLCFTGQFVDIEGTTHIWFSVSAKDRDASLSHLRESEQKFRRLFNLASECLLLLDEQGRIVDINFNGHDRLGYSKEEMLGHRISEFDTPEFAAMVPQRLEELFREGQATFESAHVCKDGTVMPIQINSRIIELNGKRHFFSVIRDITEQKAMTEQLREREEMYRAVIETSPDGFWFADMKGNLLEVNDTYVERSGYSREELLHMRISDLEAIENPEDTARHIHEIQRTGSARFESEHRAKDGSAWPVEIVTAIWPVDEPVFFVFVVDISDRKKAEARLRKLSRAVERGGEAVMITDNRGTIEYVNPAFTHITGYSENEAIGNNPSMLKSSAQDPSFYREMWETITRGEVWHGSLIDRRKDGSFYPALMSVAPIEDDSGNVTHYAAVQQDMTEYKKMEQQFHQSQKMEALGTLVGGVAHDFNNMLMGITGNLYLLRMESSEQPELQPFIDTIDKLCMRAAGIIKQMLTYAKADYIKPETQGLNSIVEEAFKLTETGIPENIERALDLHEEILYVKADSTQLQQALINIINNARDAIDGNSEGFIRCELNRYNPDDDFYQRHEDCKRGELAHLTITDNGCGIPAESFDKIFDPFYTTKRVDKGNGLGLAMVFGAISNHQGIIEVESSPELRSTTFHIYLPLVEKLEHQPVVSTPVRSTEGNGELILVADDEEHVRETYVEVLQALNYRTISASNGEEAVSKFESVQGQCALVILDMVMPKMGGVAAATGIREMDPEVPVIFATGYDRDTTLKKLHNMKRFNVIGKPFDISKEMLINSDFQHVPWVREPI